MKNKTTQELQDIVRKEFRDHPAYYSDVFRLASFELANRGIGHTVDIDGVLTFYDIEGE